MKTKIIFKTSNYSEYIRKIESLHRKGYDVECTVENGLFCATYEY